LVQEKLELIDKNDDESLSVMYSNNKGLFEAILQAQKAHVGQNTLSTFYGFLTHLLVLFKLNNY